MPFLFAGQEGRKLHEPMPDDLWESQEGHVPAVSPDDLKKVWQMSAEFEARDPGKCAGFDNSVYGRVCSPGADVESVWYGASMLWVLKQMIPEQVAKWTHVGVLKLWANRTTKD